MAPRLSLPRMCPGKPSTSSQVSEKTQASAVLFVEEEARQSFKFEVVYVAVLVALALLCMIVLSSVSFVADWPDTFPKEKRHKAQRLVALFSFLIFLRCAALTWRWWKGSITAQSWPMAVLSTLIDGWIFSAAAAGSGATSSCHGHSRIMMGQFLMNFLLSYMVLFVFPLKRSLIVAPWCLIAYGITQFCHLDCTLGLCEGEDLAPPILSITLLAVGLCLNVIAKIEVERSKWKAFLMMEEQKKEAIKEKVLRCKAEFASESVRPDFKFVSAGDASSYLGDVAEEETGDATATVDKGLVPPTASALAHHTTRPAPPSLCSAPAVLLGCPRKPDAPQLTSSAVLQPDCDAMDCLPPDALVWIEGEALPTCLEEVQPGQRVRCFDRLGGHVKHAAVLEVKAETGPVEWTTIALADGTVLDVTADHPMQPVGAEAGQACSAGPFGSERPTVHASALRPAEDHLLVLKMDPVPVKTIQTSVEDRKRIYMTVQQPERHAIFVARATSEGGGHAQPVAVESACRGHQESPWCFGASRTFVEVTTVSTAAARPASAPPSLRGRGAAPSEAASAPEEEEGSHGTPRRTGRSGKDRCEGSSATSTNSSHSSNGATRVTLGKPGSTQARLSDVIAIHAAGLPSFGSTGHAAGDCRVCVFENVHQHYGKKACFKGPFCERCHCDHMHYRRVKREGKKKPLGPDTGSRTPDVPATMIRAL